IWQEFLNLRIDTVREIHGARLSARLSIGSGCPDADHSPIGRSVLQSVGNQQELRNVFAGNDSSMRLIPVEDHILPRSLGHQISIYKNGNSALGTDLNTTGMDWAPSGARKKIFGRVNSVSGPLVFVIADIELNRRCTAEIHSIDIFIRTDCTH